MEKTCRAEPGNEGNNNLALSLYSYPTALEMVASGRVDVKPLITHTYKLEESLEAFERAKTMAGGAIKVMIRCAEEET